MTRLIEYSKLLITAYEALFESYGLRPLVHFEVEGVYGTDDQRLSSCHQAANFSKINQQLASLGIPGEVKPEFWKGQWEYVSLFNGQSPLEEAGYVSRAVELLPTLFARQGFNRFFYQPVLWFGDGVRMAGSEGLVFSPKTQAVHIPNAIQLNLSVLDDQGNNLIADTCVGELVQQRLLSTCAEHCLFFLPESDAFKRLSLRRDFNLDAELSSPQNISGGHQGSIALYRQLGKHNQKMGEEVIVVDAQNRPLMTSSNWKKTARIEHRLGASSADYCFYLNTLYALMNLWSVMRLACVPSGQVDLSRLESLPETCWQDQELPALLIDRDASDSLAGSEPSALALFKNSDWFENQLVTLLEDLEIATVETEPLKEVIGLVKPAILERYERRADTATIYRMEDKI